MRKFLWQESLFSGNFFLRILNCVFYKLSRSFDINLLRIICEYAIYDSISFNFKLYDNNNDHYSNIKTLLVDPNATLHEIIDLLSIEMFSQEELELLLS